jgi:hypothetical protein
MVLDGLNLTDEAMKLFEAAKAKAIEELKSFGNVRTRFYYPGAGKVDFADLREVIDGLMKEFNLKFPFGDRKSSYAVMVNNKAFEIFQMKIHRLSPNLYLIAMKKSEGGQVVFIIRDAAAMPDNNLKVTWNDELLTDAKVEKVDFHITRAMLDLE